MFRDIHLSKAQEILMNHVTPLSVESVKISESYDRIVAHNIIATNQLPAVAQAAMDGFALHESDLHASSPVHIKQYLQFGHTTTEDLAPGEAVGVLTGAMLPMGTAAIVPHEMIQLQDDRLILPHALRPNLNIKQPGEDLQEGEILALPGTRIKAGLISALLACGVKETIVYRQPRVVILGLAPHVISTSKLLGLGEIPDSNGPLLSCLLARDGAKVISNIFPLRDDEKLIEETLEKADLIITVGGTFAKGECEAVRLLRKWKATSLFWGVKMQPGSHNGAGIYKSRPVLCLAGNPAACAVGYELLATPLLRKMQGLTAIPPQVFATCTNTFVSSQQNAPRFLRAKADCTTDGWVVEVLPGQKSSMIRSLIDCNALIEFPVGQSEITAGSKVSVTLLDK